jgi:flagellar motility protein MotE (MotC chaperone)
MASVRRVRLIPIVIAAAAVVLMLRVVDLWHHAGTALAQAPSKPNADGNVAAPAAKAADGKPGEAKAADQKPAESSGIPEYSEAELTVLQSLSARRQAIDERAAELERREALLKAAEQRIEAKVKELKELQAKMEGAIRRYDDEEEARKKSLVKIFESMKPVEAARIFEQMDMPVLLDLIERMKERNAAPVLAQMHPARAKQVTAELARRRQLTPTNGPAPKG